MSSGVANNQLQLVIFDMDGLMFETGRIAYQAYVKTAKLYDFEMVPDVYYMLTGQTNSLIIQGMKELYGSQHDVQTWRANMVKERDNIIKGASTVTKKTGLVELLDYLHNQNICCALASSSNRDVINRYLSMEQLEHSFDVIIAGDAVSHGKPNPEIFITACELTGIEPKHALVLEDSIVGVIAAQKAEIPVFQIPDDIYDMPSFEGNIKLIQPIILPKVYPTKVFKNLLEVKTYLANKKTME